MKPTYNYGEIYGTLLHKNDDDTERKYFVIECEYWGFYRRMFSHGWSLFNKKKCERNGLRGLEIILKRKEIK